MQHFLLAACVLMIYTPFAVAGPTGRIEIDKPFPDIKLPRLDGGELASLDEYRGRKVLLHVFASW